MKNEVSGYGIKLPLFTTVKSKATPATGSGGP
jgi:hypothetical protein